MFESKAGVLFIAGIGFFAFAFLSNALLPVIMFKDLPEQPVLDYETVAKSEIVVDDDGSWLRKIARPENPLITPVGVIEKDGEWFTMLGKPAEGSETPEGVTDQGNDLWRVPTGLVVGNKRVMIQWEELERRYPENFEEHFGQANQESLAAALRLGRQVYVGEGCWHCHSQFVRPVSNESRRWGPVAETREYQNELQRPVMFGTRRVGPDLSREGGRRSSDWHAVHFFEPKIVSPDSPMPQYPWLFDGDPGKPNKRGLALIAYIQWLGSWLDSYPYYEEESELATDY